jgi:hypothetical protein
MGRVTQCHGVGHYLLALLAALASLLLAIGIAGASQVRPLNLEQMTGRAATIFAGRCLESRAVLDADLGLEVTVATFAVDEAVKGQAESTVTIKTIAGVAGATRFAAGDEVILFLYGASDLGLSSPVGLGQGRFKVATDKQGRRLALNDFANENLLRDLTPQGEARIGPALSQWKDRRDLAPEALVDMVRKLVVP